MVNDAGSWIVTFVGPPINASGSATASNTMITHTPMSMTLSRSPRIDDRDRLPSRFMARIIAGTNDFGLSDDLEGNQETGQGQNHVHEQRPEDVIGENVGPQR